MSIRDFKQMLGCQVGGGGKWVVENSAGQSGMGFQEIFWCCAQALEDPEPFFKALQTQAGPVPQSPQPQRWGANGQAPPQPTLLAMVGTAG